jgi:hypothetical protein
MDAAADEMRRAGVLEYESDFDTNGVLFLLGTNGRTTAYVNPHTTGKVVVTASSVHPNQGTLEGFIGHERPVTHGGCNYTSNVAGSFVALQLPLPLAVTRYTFRNDAYGASNALRNWNFEGSNDGDEWVVLRQHVNDQSLAAQPYATASWDVNPDGLAFLHFRIHQTGVNLKGNHLLMMAGLELYGRVGGGFAPGTVSHT